jgi:hypothetical protein
MDTLPKGRDEDNFELFYSQSEDRGLLLHYAAVCRKATLVF